MNTLIQKWGNSLGVRIPAKLAQKLHIKPGSAVDITIEGNHLIVSPQRYRLDDLLDSISEKNLHSNLLDGSAVGEEEW